MSSAARLTALIFVLDAGCAGTSGPEAVQVAAPKGDSRMVPFPSDALLGADGKLQITPPFPFDSSIEDNLKMLADTLSAGDGFGTTTSVFFPVADEVTLDAGATATLVDLEAQKTTAAWPLFYRAETKQLVAVAPFGTSLLEHHAYACVVTAGVHGKSGALHPSSAMRDAMTGKGPTAQKGAYPKLAAWVASQKTAPLAATAFTTHTLTAWVPPVLAALDAHPKAHPTRVFHAGAELDSLYGGPVTTTRPGRPSSGGVMHDAVALAVEGSFDVPHYLSQQPGTLGLFSDPPAPKATDHVPFMLVIPQRSSLAATPLVIFQHGINDDRRAVLEVSNSFCRAGYAVLGIDELWHGSRRPGAVDLVNNISGKPEPDGIGDPESFGAVQYFFDLMGDPSRNIPPLDPRYMRDNFRQATVDLMQEVRLARGGDFSEVVAADASLAALTLDGSRVTYVSESFGSILGSQVLALDPMLPAAVLDVGGGGIITDLVARSAQFAQLLQPFVAGAYDLQVDVTSGDALPARAQMSLNVLETVLEPGDGLALASAMGASGKDVLFVEAFSDETVANSSTESLAQAWGVTQVMLDKMSVPTKVVMLPQANAPYSPASGPLHALVQLDPAAHPMITVQDGSRAFAPGFPPFMKLPQPQKFENPTELVHALAVGFADGERMGKPVVIQAP